jgi:hypothetical protein
MAVLFAGPTPVPTEKIAELKLAHPDAELMLLTSAAAEVVAKVPGPVEISIFKDRIAVPATKGAATENLVRTCILWPPVADVSELLRKKPLLADRWADALLDAAGASEEVVAKKL